MLVYSCCHNRLRNLKQWKYVTALQVRITTLASPGYIPFWGPIGTLLMRAAGRIPPPGQLAPRSCFLADYPARAVSWFLEGAADAGSRSPFLYLQSQQQWGKSLSSLPSLLLLLLSPLRLSWASSPLCRPHLPGLGPHRNPDNTTNTRSTSSIISVKSLLPNEITYSQILGIRKWTQFGAIILLNKVTLLVLMTQDRKNKKTAHSMEDKTNTKS